MQHFDESEVQEIQLNDKNYPDLLKKIKNPPKALRIRGNLLPNTKVIAISGSRKTTQQAFDAAYRIGKMLAQHGYTVATGLAHGCDAYAVEGALSANGKVIGVVPRGLKSLRDATTKKLAHKIFATGGTVVSEYPDHLQNISSQHYLRRDAIITGLSEKTIIIAAQERSGSSATANHALRQGREVIITPHVKAQIRGAMIVKSPGELKDALGIAR